MSGRDEKLRRYTTEFWVGLFTFLGILLAVYMVFRTGDLRFERKKGYEVIAVFSDVAGLEVGDTVRIAGVQVGRVERIRLEDNQGKVTLVIDHRVPLYEDATAYVKTYGLLGDRYVTIDPGHSRFPRVNPGGMIRTAVSPEELEVLVGRLNEVAGDIRSVTTTLRKVLGGPEGEKTLREILVHTRDLSQELVETIRDNKEQFKRITTHLATLTTEMEAMVSENRKSVQKTLAGLPDTAENLRVITEETRRIFEKHHEDIAETLQNLRVASAQLESSLASLETISRQVKEGKGSLGKLVQDDALYEEAKSTLREARNLIEDMREQAPISAFIAVGGAAMF